MDIDYASLLITFKFVSPISFETNPVFIVRSILGWQLRNGSCIAQNNRCAECAYDNTCAYAWIFETILNKENPVLVNQNRGSHPFILRLKTPVSQDGEYDELKFELVLLGKAVNYFPYIYSALVKGGQAGFGKRRILYKVISVICNDKELISDDKIINQIDVTTWKDNQKSVQKNKEGEIFIRLKSPLRFKVDGRYTENFNAENFMNAIARRKKTICSLYGNGTDMNEHWSNSDVHITKRNVVWTDNIHYSARQKKSMQLGGVTGSFVLSGKFTQKDMELLEFAQIFGIGKNTNFGLGDIEYWEIRD